MGRHLLTKTYPMDGRPSCKAKSQHAIGSAPTNSSCTAQVLPLWTFWQIPRIIMPVRWTNWSIQWTQKSEVYASWNSTVCTGSLEPRVHFFQNKKEKKNSASLALGTHVMCWVGEFHCCLPHPLGFSPWWCLIWWDCETVATCKPLAFTIGFLTSPPDRGLWIIPLWWTPCVTLLDFSKTFP